MVKTGFRTLNISTGVDLLTGMCGLLAANSAMALLFTSQILWFPLQNPNTLNLVVFKAGVQDEFRELQRDYNDRILPVFKKACADCHAGDSAEAGFNLDSYQTIDQLLKARKKWLKVETRVAAREMPPEDYDPLTEQEYSDVMGWLDRLLNSADCTNINPGRVTIRRLNRTEYRNTVRDLLNVDYEPAKDFPGDDVGYGFDNIADVISLPPILMEKYLQAAESVTEQAIVDPHQPSFREHVPGNRLSISSGANHNDSGVAMFANSTVSADFKLPDSGQYRILVRAFGDQGGNSPVKMRLEFGGRKVANRSVRETREQPGEFEFSVRAKQGRNKLNISFTNDEYVPKDGDQKGYDRNLHILAVSVSGPYGKVPDSHRKLIPTNIPEKPDEQQKLARKILNRVASKAFRRRATTQELDKLVDLFEQARSEGDGFEIALRFPIQAIMVSPHFLYRIESPATPDRTRLLTDFELATSLSYFLWSTMPDDELFRIAGKGELKNVGTMRAQIKRMLADPKSVALVDNFAEQWLQLRHLEDFEPDPDLFPGVDRQLRDDMITETKMLFQELIQNDASIFELLSADYSFVNERLADLYGLKGVTGDEFRRVSMKDVGRIGLMTKASILTLTSNPTRTSPVKRGKWIMENLLGKSRRLPIPTPWSLKIKPN
jgi:hypothetical protein